MAGGVTITGIVRGGVVVPEGGAELPEGTQVAIIVPDTVVPPELRAEFDAWERASQDAWALIADWEKETPDDAG